MAKYSVKDGQTVLLLFQKLISEKAQLIGSLGRGKESEHDIDIYLPNHKRTDKTVKFIYDFFEAKSFEYTDWGGVYYKDTFWGDIDVFFKGCTKDFDY